MSWAEFEEKEYEHPLYHELVNDKNIWNPGQVLEAHLGFDVALRTSNPIFWKIVSRVNPLTGVNLNSLNLLNPKTILPTFHCNLMLQAKRPKYLVRKMYGYSLDSPYYRIEIDEEQQKVLQTLASRIGNSAYIGYASPAFHKRADLFSFQASSNLINKASFVGVLHLKGHDHWAYCQPGAVGQALSEPEYVEGSPFSNEIEYLTRADFFEKLVSADNPDIVKNLSILSEAIVESCQESSKYWRGEWFLNENYQIQNTLDQKQAVRYFSTIQLFCNIFNMSWFVVG